MLLLSVLLSSGWIHNLLIVVDYIIFEEMKFDFVKYLYAYTEAAQIIIHSSNNKIKWLSVFINNNSTKNHRD